MAEAAERNFKVFTQAPGVVEPGEGTFHDPTPEKLFPLAMFDFL